MSDSGSIRSASRASTLLNRPTITPVGPRTRQSTLRVSSVLENGVTSPSGSSNMDLPEFGFKPVEYTTTSPSSRVSSLPPNPTSLPALSEEPSSPESAPAYYDEEFPVASASQERPTSPVKVAPAALPPPKLVPPPVVNFETPSVQWKGLPLDAALCKQPIHLRVHFLMS